MELDDQEASSNVEDRRGVGMVKGGVGVGVIVIGLVAYFLGYDPGTVMNVAEQVAPQGATQTVPKGAPKDEMGQFVAKVLGSTEVVWGQIFQASQSQYRPPTLVLYDGQTPSGCGVAQSAVGPFYCPGDEKVYLDLAFFRDLRTRFHAPGDFAEAYVIAHEVGHHVQKLTGTFGRMEAARGRASRAEMNQISVRMELQADCYAGVWGNHAGTMHQLQTGDIAQALDAAAAVGDDRLQQQTQGRVVPDSFTHGTSEERVRWFQRGLDSGRPKDCDTFAADAL